MSKKVIWDYFKAQGFTDCGVAGLMGNLYAESGFSPKNLQNTGNKKLGMTDEEYTEAVDNGKYTYDQFRKDSQGYGLAQWTFHTRKASLYKYAKQCGKSIGDLEMQLDFLYSELKGYKEVLCVLQTATSIRQASDVVLLQFEKPADQSEKAQIKRAGYGETIYNEFCTVKNTVMIKVSSLKKKCKGEPVRALQGALNALGYSCGEADGSFGSKTEAAVKAFQEAKGLEADGYVGAKTWTALLDG